jgi:hypothetical protein
MKKLLVLTLFLPAISFAGTITTSFNPLGTITYSSGTAAAGGGGTGITFDATSSSNTVGISGGTTFNLTIGSCSYRFLAVACGGSFDTTTATVGGNSMTVSTRTILGQGWIIYTYVAPPSGSQSIALAWTNALSRPCAAASFCGVNQSTPIDVSTATFNFPDAGNSSATLVTTASGDALFDIVTTADNTNIPATTQSGQTAIFTSLTYSMGISTRAVTTAGSYDMGWSNLPTNPHSTGVLAIKAAP